MPEIHWHFSSKTKVKPKDAYLVICQCWNEVRNRNPCDFCNIAHELRVRHFIGTVHKSSSFRNYQRKSPGSCPQWVSRSVLIFFPKGSKRQNLAICSSTYRSPCQQMMGIWKGETGQALEKDLLRALKQTNCIRLEQTLESKPVWD